ncbi:MAG: hypothetical protein LBE25_13475 [Arthrobacter sp.]|jgi:hypothetical protein|nr:hypothetical protein [Arthrobacter sp.]
MASREELDQLTSVQRDLSSRAKAELGQIVESLWGLGDPALIRDALLDVVPGLAARYGEIASAVALEWFEGVYGMDPLMAAAGDLVTIRKEVRWAAGALWKTNPADAVGPLLVILDKFVKKPASDTVIASAEHNGLRWVRVPQGEKTCAFCLMLASRGAQIITSPGDWTYKSKGSGGWLSKSDRGDRFHGDCDCKVMPIRDNESMPRGYDPDRLYSMYSGAASAAGSRTDTAEILANFRRMYPDAVTDAVHIH